MQFLTSATAAIAPACLRLNSNAAIAVQTRAAQSASARLDGTLLGAKGVFSPVPLPVHACLAHYDAPMYLPQSQASHQSSVECLSRETKRWDIATLTDMWHAEGSDTHGATDDFTSQRAYYPIDLPEGRVCSSPSYSIASMSIPQHPPSTMSAVGITYRTNAVTTVSDVNRFSQRLKSICSSPGKTGTSRNTLPVIPQECLKDPVHCLCQMPWTSARPQMECSGRPCP